MKNELRRNVDFYVKKWNLTNVNKLTYTDSSEIYTVVYKNKPAILKLFTQKSDEENSYDVLKYYKGNGAVLPLRHGFHGLLIEKVTNDISLKQMVVNGKDDEATRIISEVVNRIHSKRGKPIPRKFMTLKRRFQSLYKKIDSKNTPLIYLKASKIAYGLIAQEYDQAILHGDIHHENILHDENRGWLAIDPKGLIGERTYDVANVVCNPYPLKELVHEPKRIIHQIRLLSDLLKLNSRRLCAFSFAHACLATCWSEEDSQDIAYWYDLALILEKLYDKSN